MIGKVLIWLITTVLLAPAATTAAQQTEKIFRIGFLDQSTASGSVLFRNVFRQELSKLGWIKGRNIIIEYRFSDGKNDRLRELAAELVRLKVDVIVGTSTGTVLAAKSSTNRVPIVMTSVADPVGAGLVTSEL